MEVQSHDVHKNTSFICLIESQCLAVSAVYRYSTVIVPNPVITVDSFFLI